MSGHSPAAAERDYSAVTAVLPEYRGPFPGTVDTSEVNQFLIRSWGIDFLPENGTTESLEPTTSKNSVSPSKEKVKVIVTRKPRKSANSKVSPKFGRYKEITKIVPSDEVESALETMFESDKAVSFTTVDPISSVPVSSKSCKTVSDLVAESVEKILKSPPKKMDETFSLADFKRVSNGIVAITHNGDRNSSAGVNVTNGNISKKWNNTPEKNKENSQPHSNGKIQPAKSQLELALTGKGVKCDKPDVEKSPSNYKVSNKSENKKGKEEETYVEVESELAKMFAGIEDVETTTKTVVHRDCTSTSIAIGISSNTKSTTVTNTNNTSLNSLPNSIDEPISCDSSFHNPMSSSANNVSTKTRKTVPRKRVRVRKPKNSVSSIKNAKTKQLSGKENSSLDSVASKRVPVIHIEGSKENPISVQIINSIKTEEEDSSENKTAAKRKSGKIDRPSKKLATDYVLKNYDPSSSDSSWICIFCKLYAYTTIESGEPMGDLFGPYFIRDPNRGENERLSNLEEIRKKKRAENACVDTSVSEEKSLEIWAHENCFLWAPGVHLIGSKLMGLEEAVWDSQKVKCAHCGQNGANIGCKARLCKSFMHYGCAVLAGWKLDVDKFLSICNLHAGPD